MPLDTATLRQLVELDPKDPLARFALGKRLYDEAREGAEASDALLAEAAVHLEAGRGLAPQHVATYHILAQVLMYLGRDPEARAALQEGCRRAAAAPPGGGADLLPALQQLLSEL